MSRPVAATIAFLAILMLTCSSIAPGAAAAPPDPAWQDKVDPWVLQTGAQDQTEFLVFLADQADVRAAANLPTKAARGEFVYRTLSAHTERTQGPLRQRLQQLGVEYRPYWVANMIWVRGPLAVVQALAERADVAHIYANPSVKLAVVESGAPDEAIEAGPDQPAAVEWNITKVGAPQVWGAGFTGQGAVIAGQDTGYRWTHNALKGKYRGWNGATASHDYNWHDAIHTTGSSCGANATAPCDDQGHGTHTMGTMVGDDGAGNQVGMAPGAKWIGCRNMDRGNGTPATYSECYQWFIAPTKIDGTAPNPSLAPDVINNSWGCPPSEGCTDPNVLLTVVQNVTAAGIVTVHSAGNEGSAGCSTVAEPAAIYAESFSVGATTNTTNDAIADYSSRGPVTIDGSNRMKPNISAPGSDVYSSTNSSNNSYGRLSGTSMAGPHVAGLVALLISANPSLRGNVSAIRSVIEQSAVRRTTSQGCGGDSPTAVPNNVYGWGRIDAYAAVCSAPISVLAIARLNATDIGLTWAAPAAATGYDVWRQNTPYFTPAASCPAGACTTVPTPGFTQSVLGNPGVNYTYLVQTRGACGVIQSAAPQRVGEFEFGLVQGAP